MSPCHYIESLGNAIIKNTYVGIYIHKLINVWKSIKAVNMI
jgi:hypothetical protein